MVALKASDARSFLESPDPRFQAILFYGTDEGLISESARLAAERYAAREQPPGEILRLSDQDLETDPDRLAVEVDTVPMFGGGKVVRVSTGRRINAAAIAALIAARPPACRLIVEAGSLKPADALRKLFEGIAYAAAIPCYADNARDLDALIGEVLTRHGLKIDADARALLAARLGADRALSRNEIEKLALYAEGAAAVTATDIEAIVGDAAELLADRIVMAAASGDAAAALAEFDRSAAAGESPQGVLVMLQRHLHRLLRIRAAIDAGRTTDDALRDVRPPLHFRQRDAVSRQLRVWSTARLIAALRLITEATAASRTTAQLELALVERLLMDVSALATRPARRGQ